MTNREKEEVYVSVPLQLIKDLKVQLTAHKELLKLFEWLDNNDSYFHEVNVWSDYHEKYIHEDEAYFDEEYDDFRLIK